MPPSDRIRYDAEGNRYYGRNLEPTWTYVDRNGEIKYAYTRAKARQYAKQYGTSRVAYGYEYRERETRHLAAIRRRRGERVRRLGGLASYTSRWSRIVDDRARDLVSYQRPILTTMYDIALERHDDVTLLQLDRLQQMLNGLATHWSQADMDSFIAYAREVDGSEGFHAIFANDIAPIISIDEGGGAMPQWHYWSHSGTEDVTDADYYLDLEYEGDEEVEEF